MTPRFYDRNHVSLGVGSTLTDGGLVTELVNCDEHGWKVRVHYADCTDLYGCTPLGWESNDWQCDDVEVGPCSRCQGVGWRAPDGPEGCARCGGRKLSYGAPARPTATD